MWKELGLASVLLVGGAASSSQSHSPQHLLPAQISIPAIWKSPLFKAVEGSFGPSNPTSDSSPSSHLGKDTPTANTSVLRNFQVHEPAPLLTSLGQSCSITLVDRSFSNSYGSPSTRKYSPNDFQATRCANPAEWTSLTLSIHGESQGRQFDRLGTIWIGNNHTGQGVEVWRHDNPEPTKNGIVWDISKDVGRYYSLFSQPADLVFDFPNIVDSTYTGALNVTLKLTASIADHLSRRARHSSSSRSEHGTVSSRNRITNRIVALPLSQRAPSKVFPLSTMQHNSTSIFTLGGSAGNGTTLVQLPRNTARAVVEILASGTATEEFWYTNIPDRFYSQIPEASSQGYYGHGPYREVQLYIDGVFAGYATPYPVIFTGGINPLLWRPSANYGTFDQPTYSIDITPFIGTLTDDTQHNFTLAVVSSERNGTIDDASWFVSGNVQVYLDDSSKRTIGRLLRSTRSANVEGASTGKISGGDPLVNGTLTYNVQLTKPRSFEAVGMVETGSGNSFIATWSQSSHFSNKGLVNATAQINDQASYGWTRSAAMPSVDVSRINEYLSLSAEELKSHADVRFVQMDFNYPLYAKSTLDTSSFDASVVQSFDRVFKTSSSGQSEVKKLIGNEDTLAHSHSNAGSHRFIFSHKDSNATSVLVNGSIANGTGSSYQTFMYRDMLGGTIDRSTLANTTGVIQDRLKGSIASRAQPPRLSPQ